MSMSESLLNNNHTNINSDDGTDGSPGSASSPVDADHGFDVANATASGGGAAGARLAMTDENRVFHNSITKQMIGGGGGGGGAAVESPASERDAVAARMEQLDHKGESGYISTSTPGIILEALHYFFMSFPVQIIMVLLTITDIVFLIYEFSTNKTRYEILTMLTSTAFMFECLASLGHLQHNYFIFERNWVIAEVTVVSTSFLVEYVQFILKIVFFTKFSSWIAYLRAVRFLRVLIVWRTRPKKLSTALRRLVSADRRRLEHGGYDLDLTYVNDRIMAMSWPSDGLEGLYRNNIDQVAQYLDERHPNSYQIFNLCSERAYDESKFAYRVRRFKLDDHNPGALCTMVDMALEVDAFLRRSKQNVVVIHCKGGKGRTGTMICAVFLFCGFADTAEDALAHFGKERTAQDAKSFQGVESPSQARYVAYFAELVRRARAARLPIALPPPRPVRMTKLRLHYVPLKWWDASRLWFCAIQKPSGDGERVAAYISNPTVRFNPNVGAVKHKHGPKLLAEDADDTAKVAAASGGDASRARAGTAGGAAAASVTESSSLIGGGARAWSANVVAYIATVAKGKNKAVTEDEVFATADGMRAVPLDTLRNLQRQLLGGGDDAGSAPVAAHASPTAGADGGRHRAMSADMDSALDEVGSERRVDIEFDLSQMPPLTADVLLKFYYDEDQPDTLHAPVQTWLNVNMELGGFDDAPAVRKKQIRWHRKDIDGPHKDLKMRKFCATFSISVDLELVS